MLLVNGTALTLRSLVVGPDYFSFLPGHSSVDHADVSMCEHWL